MVCGAFSPCLDQSAPLYWRPSASIFEWLAAFLCRLGGTSHHLGDPKLWCSLQQAHNRGDLFVSLFFLGSWKQRVFGAFPKKSSLACTCPVFLALSRVDKAVTYCLPWGKNEVWWEWRCGLWSQVSVDSDPGSVAKLCLPQFSQTVNPGWWWVPHKGVRRIKNSYSKHQMCSETTVHSLHAC